MASNYCNINQLGMGNAINHSIIPEDDSRLSAMFPSAPAAGSALNIAGDAAALLAVGQNAPANGSARYLKVFYNGTPLWICCSQVAIP